MLEDYTPEQQAEILRMPKAARFGFIYGMSNQKIKEQTGYTVEEFEDEPYNKHGILTPTIQGWHKPMTYERMADFFSPDSMKVRLRQAINLINKGKNE